MSIDFTDNEIYKLFTSERYSCRNYSERIPAAEEIRTLLEAAHMAPSACNKQPWRLLVIGPDDIDGRRALTEAYNRPWFDAAPWHIVVCGDENEGWVRPFDEKSHIMVDAAIITEHICLLAAAMGLATCWVCNYDPSRLADGFDFGPGIVPVAILPVGYPAEGAEVPEKKRKSLDDILLTPFQR